MIPTHLDEANLPALVDRGYIGLDGRMIAPLENRRIKPGPQRSYHRIHVRLQAPGRTPSPSSKSGRFPRACAAHQPEPPTSPEPFTTQDERFTVPLMLNGATPSRARRSAPIVTPPRWSRETIVEGSHLNGHIDIVQMGSLLDSLTTYGDLAIC